MPIRYEIASVVTLPRKDITKQSLIPAPEAFIRHCFSSSVVIPLEEETLLYQMEELAEKLGVTVRFENINMEESTSTGGLCCVSGEYIILVHSQATVKEKIKVMIEALRHFDLGNIYIKPAIRQLVEGNEE